MSQLATIRDYDYTPAGIKILAGVLRGASQTVNATDAKSGDDIVGAEITHTNANVTLQPKAQSGVIDIVNDFDWNANRVPQAYNKMPKVFLHEREQVESSLVSALYYYVTQLTNTTNNIQGITSKGNRVPLVGNIQTKLDEMVKKVADNPLGGATLDGILGAANGLGLVDLGKFFATATQEIRDIGAKDSILLGEYLKSYVGIYLTRETGFKYVLPYFSNGFQGSQNSWGATDFLTSAAFGVVDNFADRFMPLISPGTYIEKPKFFQFQQQRGDSVKLSFPLLNTVSQSYKKNYEFLWILAFQNKYYREGFASVRPPKIYTLQIPGVKYFPYAYISDLSIEFVGTRRMLDVETPQGRVTAPIPDAYMVNITIESLMSDTANAMLTGQFHSEKIRTSIVANAPRAIPVATERVLPTQRQDTRNEYNSSVDDLRIQKPQIGITPNQFDAYLDQLNKNAPKSQIGPSPTEFDAYLDQLNRNAPQPPLTQPPIT